MANPVKISDLDPILKEFYQGPIIDALNSQLEMVQLFTKTTLDWSGRRVVIPVHLSRNTGTQFQIEGGDLPQAGQQDYVNLHVTAKYLYGRFKLTGQAIASAKTTANSFATYVQSEMDRLVTDVKVRANQAMFTGQGYVGFIWDRADCLDQATVTYNFSGNKDHLRALQARARAVGGAADVLEVDVIRLDVYATAIQVGAGTGGALVATDVAGNGAAAGSDAQLVLTMCQQGGANSGALRLQGTGAGFPHNAIPRANVPCVVKVKDSGAFAAGAPRNFVVNAGGVFRNELGAEQMGLYGNLCSQIHWGIDRNLVTTTASGAAGTAQSSVAKPDEGGNHELRAAAVETNNAVPAVAGAVAPAAIDFERMQAMLDEIMVAGGDNPNCIYMHPIMRQKYAAALLWTANAGAVGGNITKDVNARPGQGDPGFSGYAFSGIPVKVSRHCGKGLAIFLNTRVWTITELQSFGMADLDGSILSRVTNKDEYEGYIRWYYELVCKEPNRNALLCGITFAA